MSVKPFDIFKSSYRDFNFTVKRNANGKPQVALWLCLGINSDGSVLGAKLTSKFKYGDDYSIPLTKADCPFLMTDSLLCINKIHPFFSDRCEVLGSLESIEKRTKIISLIDDWSHDLKAELFDSFLYSSSNK